MWICTKEVLKNTQQGNEGAHDTKDVICLVVRERCVWRNSDDHEWVAESTNSQHAEEVMGMELDNESCGVFSINQVESNVGKTRFEN